ncbi:hypothetical protein Tco_1577093 [Tanacetum coccineum]
MEAIFLVRIAQSKSFDFEYENNVQTGSTDLDHRMVATVCQEMMKMFKGQGLDPSNIASTSQAPAGTYYIGCKPYKVLSFHVTLNKLAKNLQLDLRVDWIIDIGASDHMSPYLNLFHSLRVLKKPIKIRLPNGTNKWVDKVVGKLLQTQSLIAVFFPTMFAFQDPSTKKVRAVGQGFNDLYICKPSSDTPIKVPYIPVLSSFINKEAHLYNVTLDLLHARLGHTSVSNLIHVPY